MNLYLFDGSNLAFRAHCAYPTLTVDDFPIGATYGAVRILQTFVAGWPPGKIVIPFDVTKSRYRLDLFPEYKAGRAQTKDRNLYDDYIKQLDLLIDTVRAFGLTTIAQEASGLEADDVIAFLVHLFRKGTFPTISRVVIISSDKDLCALVGGTNVVWFDPIRNNLVQESNFQETFGVSVEQYPDYKALKGDKSDNIAGAPGIGPVNAAKLLTEYGSIQALLEIKHAKVAPHEASVRLAQKLVALRLHELEPEHPAWTAILQRVMARATPAPDLTDRLKTLQFTSILEGWPEKEARLRQFTDCVL